MSNPPSSDRKPTSSHHYHLGESHQGLSERETDDKEPRDAQERVIQQETEIQDLNKLWVVFCQLNEYLHHDLTLFRSFDDAWGTLIEQGKELGEIPEEENVKPPPEFTVEENEFEKTKIGNFWKQ